MTMYTKFMELQNLSMYSTPLPYDSHNLQRHFMGCLDLIMTLNSKMNPRSCVFCGNFPKFLILNIRCFRNNYAVLFLSILKKDFCSTL